VLVSLVFAVGFIVGVYTYFTRDLSPASGAPVVNGLRLVGGGL